MAGHQGISAEVLDLTMCWTFQLLRSVVLSINIGRQNFPVLHSRVSNILTKIANAKCLVCNLHTNLKMLSIWQVSVMVDKFVEQEIFSVATVENV